MTGKIPQPFIDEVIARTDIVALIERHIPLKKAGASYLCLCPFHGDKKPSMHVIPHKQFYYCFSCGAHGNAITFLMEYEHLNFPDAVEMLATTAGLSLPKGTQDTFAQRLQPVYDLTDQVAQFYHQQLNSANGAPARAYLAKRGLTEATLQRFQVGFIDDQWDTVTKRFGTNETAQTALLQAGLCIEKTPTRRYDRFRHRIMFPIRDYRGRCIGFGGRVLDDSQPKYLNSPETPLFHKGQSLYGLYEAKQSKQLHKLLVVEGYMDVISLAERGIDYAVATLGTAVTAEHIERLIRTVKQIVFCFDGDTAGTRAAWKALTTALPLVNDDITLQFLFLPDGEDPDSLVQKIGAAAFAEKLAQAQTLATYLMEELSAAVNLETLEGRAQLATAALPYIDQIKGLVLQEQLLQALSEQTHTPLEKLRSWQQNVLPTPHTPKAASANIKVTPIRFAITLLLQHPSLAQDITLDVPSGPLKGLEILQKIVAIIANTSYITTAGILEHFRQTPAFSYLSQLAMMPLLIPAHALQQELISTLSKIKGLTLEGDIDSLLDQAGRKGLTDAEKQKLQQLLILKKTGK